MRLCSSTVLHFIVAWMQPITITGMGACICRLEGSRETTSLTLWIWAEDKQLRRIWRKGGESRFLGFTAQYSTAHWYCFFQQM